MPLQGGRRIVAEGARGDATLPGELAVEADLEHLHAIVLGGIQELLAAEIRDGEPTRRRAVRVDALPRLGREAAVRADAVAGDLARRSGGRVQDGVGSCRGRAHHARHQGGEEESQHTTGAYSSACPGGETTFGFPPERAGAYDPRRS